MLKAIVSYSKKIPVPGAEFSSQGYSLSLETEINAEDNSRIQAQLHDTFELVKASVEQELANGGAPGETRRPEGGRDNGRASNKQIKFITDLAARQGLSIPDLNADIRRRFGVEGLYDLNRKDASRLLDELKARKAA